MVYSTASHQSYLTILSRLLTLPGSTVFQPSYWRRLPVADEEPLKIYDPDEKGIEFVPAVAQLGVEGEAGVDRDPIHLRNYNMEDELYEVVRGLVDDFKAVAPEIEEYREQDVDDCEILVVAHGIVSRAVEGAVQRLRREGSKQVLLDPSH